MNTGTNLTYQLLQDFFPSRIKSMNYTMDMICIDCSVNWDGSPCPPNNPHETELLQAKHHFNTAIFGKKNTFPCSSTSWIHWNFQPFGLKHVHVSMEIIKAQTPVSAPWVHPLSSQTVAQLFLHQGLQLWHLESTQTSNGTGAPPQDI